VTSASAALARELVDGGLSPREARWLVEEFAPGGDPAAVGALRAAARRRLAGEPLQYVIGHWPFRDLDLDLDARVLIPRPETEELVDVALAELARGGARAPLVLDLGCGSGAIGLALVSELAARGVVATLVGVDRSLDALVVARRNAAKNHVARASFVHSDWFDGLDASLRGRFELITANPPYVAADEFGDLDPVLRHEPRGALVANDAQGVGGFADVAAIVAHAPPWLTPGGALVLEHGASQGAAARAAAERAGLLGARTVADLAGRDRFLVARASS
jgi:release factor glutamine methyltransferase